MALLLLGGCVRPINKRVGEVKITPDQSWGVDTVGLIRTYEVKRGKTKKTEVEELELYGDNSIPEDTTGLFFLFELVSRGSRPHMVECKYNITYSDDQEVETGAVQYEGSVSSIKHRIDLLRHIDPRRPAEVRVSVSITDERGRPIFPPIQQIRYSTPAFLKAPEPGVPKRFSVKDDDALVRTFWAGSGESSRLEGRELDIGELVPVPSDTLGLYLMCLSPAGIGEHNLVSYYTISYQDGETPHPVKTRVIVYRGKGGAKHRIDLLRHIDPRRPAKVSLLVRAERQGGEYMRFLPPVEYFTPVLSEHIKTDM